jgi:hypothetical protein
VKKQTSANLTSSKGSARERSGLSLPDKENPLNRFGFSTLTEKERTLEKESSDRKRESIDQDDEEGSRKKPHRVSGRVIKQLEQDSEKRKKTNRKAVIEKKGRGSKSTHASRTSHTSRSSRSSRNNDDGEEDEDEELQDSNLRKSSRTRASSTIAYTEADSDDEFARNAFILPESEGRSKRPKRQSNSVKRKTLPSSKSKNQEEVIEMSDSEAECVNSYANDFSDSEEEGVKKSNPKSNSKSNPKSNPNSASDKDSDNGSDSDSEESSSDNEIGKKLGLELMVRG